MGYQIKCELRQETIMIHFQPQEIGACLRASELKPKLDRFIEKYRKEKIPKQWRLDASGENKALNYKIRIRAMEKFKPEEVEKIYFGNMGLKEEEWKQGVFYRKGPEITIICFIPELLKEIEDNIEGFFLLTNFGTRQSKGTGSFRVLKMIDMEGNERVCFENENLLDTVKKYKEGPIYGIKYHSNVLDYKERVRDAVMIYNLMKGGINYNGDYFKGFIFRYYWKNPHKARSEKAFIKAYFFHDEEINLDDYQFIRACLGLPDHYDFKNTIGKTKRKESEVEGGKIEVQSKDIERFQAPITFKIFGRYMLLLPCEIPQELLDKEFGFSMKYNRNEREPAILKTPAKFDINDFIAQFCVDFNNKEKRRSLELANDSVLKRISKLKIEQLI